MVSVLVTAYNHEKFIVETLEGILMQKTNFRVEIIINDDCSTDNTAAIIRKYETECPVLYKTFYQNENQYSQGKKPWYDVLFPAVRGKYIALCEGDDYWIDETKLQQQVDFLEDNEAYVMCGHDAKTIDENGKILNNSKLPDEYKKDATSEELICGYWVLTLSMCFRNVTKDLPFEITMVKNGDTFLNSFLGQYGSYKFQANIKPAAYRVHNGGVWSLISEKDKVLSQLTTFYWIVSYFIRIDKKKYADIWLSKMHKTALMAIEKKEIELTETKKNKSYIIGRFVASPFIYFKSIISSMKNS
jgi:glycosyltransferase involved in cell wall biosynthesis